MTSLSPALNTVNDMHKCLCRITITNTDYNTVFEIRDAVRKDTAKYKVSLYTVYPQ